MNLFEWETLTENMCPRCKSRLFNSLQLDQKDELIDSVVEIHSFYDCISSRSDPDDQK